MGCSMPRPKNAGTTRSSPTRRRRTTGWRRPPSRRGGPRLRPEPDAQERDADRKADTDSGQDHQARIERSRAVADGAEQDGADGRERVAGTDHDRGHAGNFLRRPADWERYREEQREERSIGEPSQHGP